MALRLPGLNQMRKSHFLWKRRVEFMASLITIHYNVVEMSWSCCITRRATRLYVEKEIIQSHDLGCDTRLDWITAWRYYLGTLSRKFANGTPLATAATCNERPMRIPLSRSVSYESTIQCAFKMENSPSAEMSSRTHGQYRSIFKTVVGNSQLGTHSLQNTTMCRVGAQGTTSL